jgi:hypothetical protein
MEKNDDGSNALLKLTITNAKLQVGKQERSITQKNDKLQRFDQKTIAEKIKAIQEIYQELERID